MGVLCDYFAAADDLSAARVLSGGPADAGMRRVDGTGILPPVQTGTLEALLTGETHDTRNSSSDDHVVGDKDDGEQVVFRLPSSLVDVLSAASPRQLREVAEPWAATEEFWGEADPEHLAEFLDELAALARDARKNGEGLYCWICV
jgi:hypothetical protein